MQILGTEKIKYLICFQFRCTKQTSKTFFANFSNYIKDRHRTANGHQNVILCKIVKMWKEF